MLPSILPNLRTFSTAGGTRPRNQCPLVFADRCQHPTDQSTGRRWGWDRSLGCCEEQTCGHTSETEKNQSAPEEGFSADNAAETGLAGTWGSQLAQQGRATPSLCKYCWEGDSPGGLFCVCYIELSDPAANPERPRCLGISRIPVPTNSAGESLGFITPGCETAPPFSCVWGACQRQVKKGAAFPCGPPAQKSGRPTQQAARVIWNGRGEVDFCVLC